jgi:hypothetical protein
MEDIPSCSNRAYQKVAVIAKAVSGFVKTSMHPFNPHVFRKEHFISGEVSTTVTRGGIDPSHEEEGTCYGRGVSDPRNETDVAGSSGGDTESSKGGVTIVEISPIPSTSGLYSRNIMTKTTLRNLNVDSKESYNRKGGTYRKEG